MTYKKDSSTKHLSLIPRLIEAGLAGDRQKLELLSLTAIRTLKAEFPELSEELGGILARNSTRSMHLRAHTAEPPPADADAGLSLLRIFSTDQACEPIFTASVSAIISRFLREQKEKEKLLSEGFAPPRTLLLKGAPGTGKTMLAQWLARELGLKLVVLDLATAISSYLGKTGANLRRSLDYGRATPCLFLIDEFDAIGKRRDDMTEVGELKRIVNVLLKELEEWPLHSVLVAATNHPELLDPAIHRRFDVVIETPLPDEPEREVILTRACGRFAAELPRGFFSAMASILVGSNGSELDTLAKGVIRRHVIDHVPLLTTFVEAALAHSTNSSRGEFGPLVKILKGTTDLTVREIAALVGKSSSAVQYHLKKTNQE